MLRFDVARLPLIVIGATHEISALFANELAALVYEAVVAHGTVEHRLFRVGFGIRMLLMLLLRRVTSARSVLARFHDDLSV